MISRIFDFFGWLFLVYFVLKQSLHEYGMNLVICKFLFFYLKFHFISFFYFTSFLRHSFFLPSRRKNPFPKNLLIIFGANICVLKMLRWKIVLQPSHHPGTAFHLPSYGKYTGKRQHYCCIISPKRWKVNISMLNVKYNAIHQKESNGWQLFWLYLYTGECVFTVFLFSVVQSAVVIHCHSSI